MTEEANLAVCPKGHEAEPQRLCPALCQSEEVGTAVPDGHSEQAPNLRWSPKDEQPKPTAEQLSLT